MTLAIVLSVVFALGLPALYALVGVVDWWWQLRCDEDWEQYRQEQGIQEPDFAIQEN